MENPECNNLQHGERNQTPELAGVAEHASRGSAVQEQEEERNNQDEDKGVTVNGGKGLGVFFFLLGALQGVDLFENFLGNGGTLRHDFHATRHHALNERHLVAGFFAASNRFFFEVENVRHHEHEQSFVEGTQEPLFVRETHLELSERFVNAAAERLDIARFDRRLFVVLNQRDVRLGVDDILEILQVVVVAVQLGCRFGACNKGVRNAGLEHAVEHVHQRVAGLGIQAQGLNCRSRNTLLQDFINARSLHHLGL